MASSYRGTIAALELLIEVSDSNTRIVPGHGVVSNVGEVRAQREMLIIIGERVKAAVAAGQSLEEAQVAGLTAEFDERWDSGRRIGGPAELIRAAYEDMAE